MGIISIYQPAVTNIVDVVDQFPQIFEQAVIDWAKFKAADEANVFMPKQRSIALQWFLQFPKLWEGIEPHFRIGTGGPVSPEMIDFADRVTAWVKKFKTNPTIQGELGIATIIIILGIAVAAAFGAAGVTWAVGYVKEQNNVSRIIDETVAGNISEDVLQKAVDKEKASAFSDITDIFKYGLITGAIFLLWPQIRKITG